jgi:hypothetical protein
MCPGRMEAFFLEGSVWNPQPMASHQRGTFGELEESMALIFWKSIIKDLE